MRRLFTSDFFTFNGDHVQCTWACTYNTDSGKHITLVLVLVPFIYTNTPSILWYNTVISMNRGLTVCWLLIHATAWSWADHQCSRHTCVVVLVSAWHAVAHIIKDIKLLIIIPVANYNLLYKAEKPSICLSVRLLAFYGRVDISAVSTWIKAISCQMKHPSSNLIEFVERSF